MRIFKTKKSFRKEFRRQLKFALIAAIGFTVAFAWRNAIFSNTQKLITKLTEQTQLIQNEFLTALLITFFAVFAILIISKILGD